MQRWHSVAISDTGKKRQINEDSLYTSDAERIWAVADGMGGHARGDYASQTVVKHLEHYADNDRTGVSIRKIEQLLNEANTSLIRKAAEDDDGIVASTVAILTAQNDSVICSWAGDSRIYRYRDGSLLRLTRDHNYEALLEDLSNSGVDTKDSLVDPQALTRGVGAEETLSTEHSRYTSMPGDRYLICTDGLYKEIEDVQIQQYFSQLPDNQKLLEQLHETYLTNGASDNLGMIVASLSAD